jgi:hypothetical protein
MQRFNITIGPIDKSELPDALKAVDPYPLITVNFCTSKGGRKPYTRKRRISDDDRKLMKELRQKGKTLLEVSAIIGCSDETVRRHLAAMGLNYER